MEDRRSVTEMRNDPELQFGWRFSKFAVDAGTTILTTETKNKAEKDLLWWSPSILYTFVRDMVVNRGLGGGYCYRIAAWGSIRDLSQDQRTADYHYIVWRASLESLNDEAFDFSCWILDDFVKRLRRPDKVVEEYISALRERKGKGVDDETLGELRTEVSYWAIAINRIHNQGILANGRYLYGFNALESVIKELSKCGRWTAVEDIYDREFERMMHEEVRLRDVWNKDPTVPPTVLEELTVDVGRFSNLLDD